MLIYKSFINQRMIITWKSIRLFYRKNDPNPMDQPNSYPFKILIYFQFLQKIFILLHEKQFDYFTGRFFPNLPQDPERSLFCHVVSLK